MITSHVPRPRDIADGSPILEIKVHVPAWEEAQVHGTHQRIEEVPGPINVEGVLDLEATSLNQREQIMVCRKCCYHIRLVTNSNRSCQSAQIRVSPTGSGRM